MLFDFLKRFFSWADEGSRKRTADSEYVLYDNPLKKPRCHHEKMQNGKDIIEIEEDDDDEVQICGEIKHKHQAKHKHTGTIQKPFLLPFSNNIGHNHNPSVSQSTMSTNAATFRNRTSLTSRPVRGYRHSTLNRSYRLREKEEYGQMLQNFLPQRVQILQSKSDSRKHLQKPIEIIDVENYKPAQSPSNNPEIFSTPKLKTPTRWFTPMTNPMKKPVINHEKSSIVEIELDDSDESPINSRISSPKDRKKENRIEELKIQSEEAIPTNTLRDKLSAKDVMKADFIPRVAQEHDGRIQQRYKEAEELEKMTRVLAKHNRLQREVALEKQLAQSLKICEAVLEEADYQEEPELPELSNSMLEQVKHALKPHPASEVLVEAFSLSITRKDINTLAGLQWLNDEVINFYMNLLIDRGGKNKFPKVYAMNTFFYPKLLSSGHSSLKRWTRKVDIFAQDLVVVPIHLGMHWCMSIIDFRDKSIRYYDSMGGENPTCLMALRKYLVDESLDKKKKSYDVSDWTLESMTDIPQQMNGSDCGVFSCTFAEYICANRKLTFSQDDMPYFRSKMVYEILNAKLL